MALSEAMSLKRGNPMPVKLWWSIGDDGGDVPYINIQSDDVREEIFEEFDATSVEELSENALSPYKRQHRQEVQLGLVLGRGDDSTFITEPEALATVENIDKGLASHLIDWFTDLPTLCRRIREDPYLSAMHNDVQVEADTEEEAAWVEEFETGPELERRMKDAGVWFEPDDRVAH